MHDQVRMRMADHRADLQHQLQAPPLTTGEVADARLLAGPAEPEPLRELGCRELLGTEAHHRAHVLDEVAAQDERLAAGEEGCLALGEDPVDEGVVVVLDVRGARRARRC